MTILIFLLILSFLVLIHELGHFLAARKAGVKVEEFGIGYPPRALTLYTDKQGTIYSLNFLPFGGFVRLYGEEDSGGQPADTSRLFYRKPRKTRLLIILSGVFINFLFGALAFGAIYTKTGIPESLGFVRIEEVTSGAPAQNAGLTIGDEVRAVIINGEERAMQSADEFVLLLSAHRGEEVTLLVNRQGEQLTPFVYVRTEAETPAEQGAIGVTVSDLTFTFYPFWQMPFRGIFVGTKAAIGFGVLFVKSLSVMIKDLLFAGVVPKDVAGPIQIVYVAQKEELLTSGTLGILNFMAILSINLAIVNAIPFPALDGGRALFVLIEGFFGKRRAAAAKLERWMNIAGMAVLLTLIVLISIRDLSVVIADAGVQQWWKQLVGRIL